jgi:hypothetical protein
MPLHGMRHLRDGRYSLVVRAALGPAVRVRHTALVVG